MPTLMVVNPTPTARKAKTHTRGRKAKKGNAMAKRRRTAAQRAATARMLAANRSRKRTKNPSPRRYHRRHANPVHHVRRRHKNPSSGGTGNLFSELMSKDGLMSIAAVVATPTLAQLAVGYFAPQMRGYTRVAVKAAVGLGIAWAVHKYVSKKAGLVAGLVSVGSAAAEVVEAVTMNGYGGGKIGLGRIQTITMAPRVPGGVVPPRRRPQAVSMRGYGATATPRPLAIEPGAYFPIR